MSELIDTIDQIQETVAAIAPQRVAVKENPNVPSLSSSLRSLEKRLRTLEEFYQHQTNEYWLDVLTYKLTYPEGERPKALALAETLSGFQKLYTLVYDAQHTKIRKDQNRVNVDSVESTSFNFDYTFPGSLGIALSLPNERPLLEEIETDIDRAMNTVFEMTQVSSSEEVAEFARVLGSAPVRMLYQWVSAHTKSGLGLVLDWKREQSSKSNLNIEVPALAQLQKIIAETSEESSEDFSVVGVLRGLLLEGHQFELEVDGRIIKGRMMEILDSESKGIVINHLYRAHLRKTSRISYATEEVETHFYLLSIEPINNNQ